MTKKPVETYDDAEAFRRAAAGKKPKQASKGSELPRAPAGIGDKHAALMRLAVYGISMRFDAGAGFCGWNARTGQRYSIHQDYAAAIKAAEEEANQMSSPEELPARDMFGARPGEYVMPDNAFPTKCHSCGAPIIFVRTKAGRMMPLALSTVETRDGIKYAMPHWIDCVDSKEWSGKP